MSNFELLEPGVYRAVAVKRTDGEGVEAYARLALTSKEDFMVIAYIQLIDHPETFPIPWRGTFGDTIMGKGSKNEKTVRRRTVESLKYMVFKGEDISEVETQELDQIISVVVEHDEHEGKTRLKIAWVNQSGGGTIQFTPMKKSDIKSFAKKMRAGLSKINDVGGERFDATTTPEPADKPAPRSGGGGKQEEEPPPVNDDDIPFLHCFETTMGPHGTHQPGGKAV